MTESGSPSNEEKEGEIKVEDEEEGEEGEEGDGEGEEGTKGENSAAKTPVSLLQVWLFWS